MTEYTHSSVSQSTQSGIKVRSEFVKINRVPTRITCWGKWIQESFDEDDSKDIVLMIAGNPGITGYYEHFLETIHEETGYNVWILSHAGHETPEQPMTMKIPSLHHHEGLYTLTGQTEHKIAFIREYVPRDCRLHLVGHSIGAHMCINLLRDPLLKEQVQKVYLLFPTIEHMASTPNGRFYVNVMQRLQTFIIMLAYLFVLLPSLLRSVCVYMALLLHGSDASFVRPTLMLATPHVARFVMFLADDEMARVKKRDTELIRSNQQKLFVLYGRNDNWAPISYCQDLKNAIPDLQVQVAPKEFQHAYVLKHSVEMGVLMSDLLRLQSSKS